MAAGREVLFEMRQVGRIVRVTAIDTATMQEVIIQGPMTAGEAALRSTAMAKLDYVLRKLTTGAGRSRPS